MSRMKKNAQIQASNVGMAPLYSLNNYALNQFALMMLTCCQDHVKMVWNVIMITVLAQIFIAKMVLQYKTFLVAQNSKNQQRMLFAMMALQLIHSSNAHNQSYSALEIVILCLHTGAGTRFLYLRQVSANLSRFHHLALNTLKIAPHHGKEILILVSAQFAINLAQRENFSTHWSAFAKNQLALSNAPTRDTL